MRKTKEKKLRPIRAYLSFSIANSIQFDEFNTAIKFC